MKKRKNVLVWGLLFLSIVFVLLGLFFIEKEKQLAIQWNLAQREMKEEKKIYVGAESLFNQIIPDLISQEHWEESARVHHLNLIKLEEENPIDDDGIRTYTIHLIVEGAYIDVIEWLVEYETQLPFVLVDINSIVPKVEGNGIVVDVSLSKFVQKNKV